MDTGLLFAPAMTAGRSNRNRFRLYEKKLSSGKKVPFCLSLCAGSPRQKRSGKSKPPSPPPVLELKKPGLLLDLRSRRSGNRSHISARRVFAARIVHQVVDLIPNSFPLPQKSKCGGQIEEPVQPARVPCFPADRFRGTVCVRRELSVCISQNQQRAQ